MTPTKYSMSFTTGALFFSESLKLTELYISANQWNDVRIAVISGNIIQSRTVNTLKRVTNEIISRLRTLREQEIKFLSEADYTEQGYLLWLAVCRRYAFIADFAVEIVHGNFASLKSSVTHEEYNIFFNKKAEWHAELDRIAPSTKNKIRQTLFRMMQEAHLLDKNDVIIPIVPSAAFRAILAGAMPREAMFFPISELARSA